MPAGRKVHMAKPPQKQGKHLLIRDAKVSVSHHVNEKRQNEAVFRIGNGKGEMFEHRFGPTSRVSKHLELMTAQDLQERFTGGSFFFIDDTLVDFRDAMYMHSGFVHTDESIAKFIEVLGYMHKNELPLHRGSPRKRNQEGESDIILRKVWSKGDIIVPGYKGGADFQSQLSFKWNPYEKTINSAFDLIRLICTNGMVGLTSFLNNKVPLLNRWEEHLDIASRQIQNKVASTVEARVDRMASAPASVGDCLLLEEHAFERLHSPQSSSTIDEEMYTKLLRLLAAVSPSQNLESVYREAVFTDKTLAKQLPAHLSQFDAFNIATELRTHTAQTGKSSDHALDRFANQLLFEVEDNYSAAAAAIGAPKRAAFSDPERAFFGQVSTDNGN